MRAVNFAEQAIEMTQTWGRMHINPVHLPAIDAAAKRIFANKARFLRVTNLTHVPWDVIAVIKEREAGVDPNFKGFLGNGQMIIGTGQKSTLVPADRGPFSTWEGGAYDALVNCPPFARRWKDWSIGGKLTLLMEYNGEGYWEMGVSDPYIWAFTDQYVKGKYGRDGHYDPNLV